MIKAIIFDLDQTLIDRTSTFILFLKDQYQRFASHMASCEESTYLEAVLSFDDNGYKDKRTMFSEVCRHLDLSIDSSVLFEDFKIDYGSNPILFDGVLETLEALKKQYVLAVITNGRVKSQSAKIRLSGIESYFSEVTISEGVDVKKPNPKIFLHCIEKLAVGTSECVYVGDNPENDVNAAIKMGMKAIWVKNNHFAPPSYCDGVINSISEISNLLETLSS